MVRTPKLEKTPERKGPWSPDEDQKLITYIQRYGIWNWSRMPKPAGLSRSGKSCRLRWVNYLRPDIKRGRFSQEEEDTILKLHESMGNRWSAIAAKLPGRTDNEIKNYWHTYLKKRIKAANGSVKEAEVFVFNDKANSKKRFSSSEAEIFLLNEAPKIPKLETTPASSCFCGPVHEIDDHKQQIAEQSVGAISETVGVGEVQSLWAQANPQLVQDSEEIFTDPGLVTFFQEPCDSYNDYWVNLLSTR